MAKWKKLEFSLGALMGIPWWIPAALASAAYAAVQWGIPAIAPATPLVGPITGMLKTLGMAITAVLGCIAAFLYYRQRASKSSMPDRLLEPQPHIAVPVATTSPKSRETEIGDHARDEPETHPLPGSPSPGTRPWSLDFLRQIKRTRFEELVAAYFREESFRTEATRIAAEEGVDIRLFEKGKTELYAIVQCKACDAAKVGVGAIRELLGAMTHERVSRGVYVTTGDYTQEAIDFAGQHPIILITGAMLTDDILSYSDYGKTRLMNVLTEAEPDAATRAAAEAEPIMPGGAAEEPASDVDVPLLEFEFSSDKQ